MIKPYAEAFKNDKQHWKNKIFRVEIDQKQIKVISKRRGMQGKGFIVDLPTDYNSKYDNKDIEFYIWNRYTTEVYKYC